VPAKATVDKVDNNLDGMRGLQVYLDNVGAVSMYSVRTGLADAGAKTRRFRWPQTLFARPWLLPGSSDCFPTSPLGRWPAAEGRGLPTD